MLETVRDDGVERSGLHEPGITITNDIACDHFFVQKDEDASGGLFGYDEALHAIATTAKTMNLVMR